MFEFNATLIVAMISFVVFMFIMNAIFYRPMLNIIRKREEYINTNYDEAKKYTDMAQTLNTEYNTKLDEAKENGRNNLAYELDNAQKKSIQQTREIKEQAKIQIENNKNTNEKYKKELYKQINSNLANDLSSEIVRKIVGKTNANNY